MPPPLYPHQRAALERAILTDGNLAIFHEPGLGKTRTCLELFSLLRVKEIHLKLLVICPLSLIHAAWGAEIAQTPFRPTLVKSPDATADIWLVNFESIIRPQAHRRLEPLWSSPVMLVVDESSRLRDPRSLTTKVVVTIADRCQYHVVCSGTPAPNGLYELWGQIRVVAPSRVHRSYYAWRREYFHLRRGHVVLNTPPPNRQSMQQLFQSGWKWDITPQKRDQLLRTIAPITHWVKKEEALQLPERIVEVRHLTLSADEKTAYETMRKQLVVEFEQETVTAEIALTKLQKLRQLASGFLYGETVHQLGQSRLALLKETLEDLGQQPIIIWAHFKEEIHQIAHCLGARAVTLYSETPDKEASLAAFGKTAQYLIAHPRSAAHGLTLIQSSTIVWYSLDWSLEAYRQANDRIHRIGQQRSCLYVHLLAPGLIDETIWSVLQQKATLADALSRALGSLDSRRDHPRHQNPLAARVGLSSR